MVLKATALVLILASTAVWEAESIKMTMEQMEQATGPVKMVCIQKFQIDESVALGVRDGKIPDVKEVKCYINCIFEMMQMTRKGKIQFDSVMKNIESLPEDLYEDTKRAMEACKGSTVGIKDPCEAAYALIKCLTKENPKFYFP